MSECLSGRSVFILVGQCLSGGECLSGRLVFVW